jgi:hypothetical protein
MEGLGATTGDSGLAMGGLWPGTVGNDAPPPGTGVAIPGKGGLGATTGDGGLAMGGFWPGIVGNRASLPGTGVPIAGGGRLMGGLGLTTVADGTLTGGIGDDAAVAGAEGMGDGWAGEAAPGRRLPTASTAAGAEDGVPGGAVSVTATGTAGSCSGAGGHSWAWDGDGVALDAGVLPLACNRGCCARMLVSLEPGCSPHHGSSRTSSEDAGTGLSGVACCPTSTAENADHAYVN